MTVTSEPHWRQARIDVPNYQPKQAMWGDQFCQLVKYHAPIPSILEFHHSKPVFLQNRLYGNIKYGADLWLCSNCHDSVHEWLYWLLNMRRLMPHVGYAAREEATRTFEWYNSERIALGLPEIQLRADADSAR
jgi:hypothetical protein